MKGYVTIRKQTLANVIAIAATAAMAICSWHKFHLEAASRDAAKVETESCNYLNAKGKTSFALAEYPPTPHSRACLSARPNTQAKHFRERFACTQS